MGSLIVAVMSEPPIEAQSSLDPVVAELIQLVARQLAREHHEAAQQERAADAMPKPHLA